MAKVFTLDEVKKHNKPTDLWIIIENKVYDVTKFQSTHPGGANVLLEVAGHDATKNFKNVGHSKDAQNLLAKYYIGDLAPDNK